MFVRLLVLVVPLLAPALSSAQAIKFPEEESDMSCSAMLENNDLTEHQNLRDNGATHVCPPGPRLASSLLDTSKPARYDEIDCGLAASRSVLRNINVASVVGGWNAISVWPWMALLGKTEARGMITWLCGGVLISRQWLLSAAHCFTRILPNVVRLGEYDYEDKLDGAPHQDVEVDQVVLHPDYHPAQGYHDLALVRLKHEVTIQRFIRPVCLAWGEEARVNSGSVTLTGWGQTAAGGNSSSILQEVILTVFPSSRCDQQYKVLPGYTRNWPRGIGVETVCAGSPSGGHHDACKGDSGGPIVYPNATGRYVLAGVVSQGYGCGKEDFHGLYASTKHSPHLAWLKQVAFGA